MRRLITDVERRQVVAEYLNGVRADFEELLRFYPFAGMRQRPSIPPVVHVRVVAASAKLVAKTMAVEADFIGEYSKELHVVAPLGYRMRGCDVYGGRWIRPEDLAKRDWHFYVDEHLDEWGYRLCVGVPESFVAMNNVLLECVKTADSVLVAYERAMRSKSKGIGPLTAYSHGAKGIGEYRRDQRRYQPA